MIDLEIVHRQNLVDRHMIICSHLNEIYEKKNKDYGDSFKEVYKDLGVVSCITQIAHKYNRIKNLVKNPENANFEGLNDSLLDLANYCIMTMLILEEEDTKEKE